MTNDTKADVDPAFWAARWKEGKIGFHEGRPNAFLERHVGRLGSAAKPARRVLVPFCGKAEDLAFLAGQGHEVVGVEVVEDAVRAFFAERGLSERVRTQELPDGRGRAWLAGTITILCGNLFDLRPEDVGPLDAVYDRAALIALMPHERDRYVRHIRTLLAPASLGLLVTFEYPAGAMAGPPFSVSKAEALALYDAKTNPDAPGKASAEHLESSAAGATRFRDSGVDATEHCFALAF